MLLDNDLLQSETLSRILLWFESKEMEKFYFFNSFLDTARAIPDDEMRLKYLMAVAEY